MGDRAEPGCLECEFYWKQADHTDVRLVERWADRHSHALHSSNSELMDGLAGLAAEVLAAPYSWSEYPTKQALDFDLSLYELIEPEET